MRFQKKSIDIFRAIADQLGAVLPNVIREFFSEQPEEAALPQYIDDDEFKRRNCECKCKDEDVK